MSYLCRSLLRVEDFLLYLRVEKTFMSVYYLSEKLKQSMNPFVDLQINLSARISMTD